MLRTRFSIYNFILVLGLHTAVFSFAVNTEGPCEKCRQAADGGTACVNDQPKKNESEKKSEGEKARKKITKLLKSKKELDDKCMKADQKLKEIEAQMDTEKLYSVKSLRSGVEGNPNAEELLGAGKNKDIESDKLQALREKESAELQNFVSQLREDFAEIDKNRQDAESEQYGYCEKEVKESLKGCLVESFQSCMNKLQAHTEQLKKYGMNVADLKNLSDGLNGAGLSRLNMNDALMGTMIAGQLMNSLGGMAGQGSGGGGGGGNSQDAPTGLLSNGDGETDPGTQPLQLDPNQLCSQMVPGGQIGADGKCSAKDPNKEACQARGQGFQWDGYQCVAQQDNNQLCQQLSERTGKKMSWNEMAHACLEEKGDGKSICGDGEKLNENGYCQAAEKGESDKGGNGNPQNPNGNPTGGGGGGGSTTVTQSGTTTGQFPEPQPLDPTGDKSRGSMGDLGLRLGQQGGGSGGGSGKSLSDRYGGGATGSKGGSAAVAAVKPHGIDGDYGGAGGGGYSSGGRSRDSSGGDSQNPENKERSPADAAGEGEEEGPYISGAEQSIRSVSRIYDAILSAGPKEPYGIVMESMRVRAL